MGIEDVVTAPHAPWQNPFVERFVGSARRECFDHAICSSVKLEIATAPESCLFLQEPARRAGQHQEP
jgi:hypothetical protein